MNQKGKLVIITGPSGVGKGTIVKSLLAKNPQIFLSISATTRLPRKGEIDGKDYYFLSRLQFEEMINKGELLEWAQYAGNYYGTPIKPVLEKIEQGKTIILEIEVLGANQIKNNFSSATRIFILPPSIEELEKRLRERNTDTEEVIIKRLNKAKEELAVSEEFDYQIINDNLDLAITEIEEKINNVI
ncbi:MAG: guanylate kinase [Cyanobacteria bacterium]|nr:guanylate kinase [Cyanobacteria bacterium CG_2015-16_32_12]NCO77869.1 guanylate kinase [Cyanobacteria bacterium CG_2015-22_32_23]NCQ03068.1 guanylate kinase [Cyanobacteria bacterium CG_2015-09_32_10]NCQ41967.1 guanylate kinase [Cyanobacteria bacterium CG_2015-04_32_10]NCS84821.1 guanylate kinase [Cyanobacteria bacterium CG_2015-02_32_10]